MPRWDATKTGQNLPCLTTIGLQEYGMVGGEQWDDWSGTPWFRWVRPDGVHLELWYDNPRSLQLKVAFAAEVGAGGVSMWNANTLDYSNSSQVAAFWGSFSPFAQEVHP